MQLKQEFLHLHCFYFRVKTNLKVLYKYFIDLHNAVPHKFIYGIPSMQREKLKASESGKST